MKKHFLLYLDILGFSDLVADPERVIDLYRVINSLNVHRHDAFRAIVFSDTLLVYNDFDIRAAAAKQYAVMFLCEFAQDLLYRTVGRDFYFRSLVTYGDFHHERMDNLDAFFGPALVTAYRKERNIKCPGVFIDDYCNGFNLVFETRPYATDCHFVYVTQSLQRLNRACGGNYPAPAELLTLSSGEYDILRAVHLLKDIHHQMVAHADPEVRAKFLSAWSYYSQQYVELTTALADGNFDPNTMAILDWTDAEAIFQEDSNA